jgi:hypothetical protein
MRKMMGIVYVFLASLGIGGLIAWVLLCLGLVVGYFMNVWKLAMMVVHQTDMAANWVLFLGRVLGVCFGPLGALLGFFA